MNLTMKGNKIDLRVFFQKTLDIHIKMYYNNVDSLFRAQYAFPIPERSFYMDKKMMSREGYENLKAQLNELITVQRPEIAQKLKEARSYGDLSENAEYDEAKNDQAQLEAKIAQLQYTLDHAVVVENENISLEEIGMGSIMTIKDLASGEVEELKIVGTNEANFFENKISDESPIGKAAMKKRVGDTFIVETPNGELRYEVVGISK